MRKKAKEHSGRADDAAQSAPVVLLREGFVASTGASVDARERLIANMQLVERAMESIVEADPMKIVQLSTRHSELVAQLIAVTGAGRAGESDPFDRFLAARDAAGGATAAPRK